MSNKSLIREKIGEIGYKKFNSDYPLIEGYLFQKLDDLIILMSLTGNYKYDIYNGGTFFIAHKKAFRFSISFDKYTRKIGIHIVDGLKKLEIHTDIYNQLNLNTNKNHFCLSYEFKYNYKNCQRIIDIAKLLITRD